MVTDPRTNQVLWTTEPMGEDRAYGDKFSPPWCGKAKQIAGIFQILTLYSFDKKTGALNLGYNTFTHVSFEHLFETKEEALREYARLLRERMKTDRVNLAFALDELRKIHVNNRDRRAKAKETQNV